MIKPRITATENGPFRVLHITRLVTSKNDELETEAEMYLCRCGGSSNKPYCDRTHETNGFSGKNPVSEGKHETVVYKGTAISIYDNRNICSHRGYCTSELPTVFRDADPWIDPDGDTLEKIIAICDKCPSGALSYSLHGKQRIQGREDEEPKIRLSERHFGYHGPYDITGKVQIDGQLRRTPESELKATLCRCGQSMNKPFCDGEHYESKFEDEKNE